MAAGGDGAEGRSGPRRMPSFVMQIRTMHRWHEDMLDGHPIRPLEHNFPASRVLLGRQYNSDFYTATVLYDIQWPYVMTCREFQLKQRMCSTNAAYDTRLEIGVSLCQRSVTTIPGREDRVLYQEWFASEWSSVFTRLHHTTLIDCQGGLLLSPITYCGLF